ncbi:MAG: Acyl-CoA thioesterase [Pseudomonadota bacterium]|jgi:hypothetical protein
MSTTVHPFDHAVQLTKQSDGLWLGHTSTAYGNMVGPFGGITSAVLLNAIQQHPARIGDPISLTVNFAGPIEDGPFTIEAKPVRTNRSTQHWSLNLIQHNGEVATTGSAVFAIRRDTWESTEIIFPMRTPALELARADTSKAPEWTRRYDLRPLKGLMIDGQQPNHELDAVTEFWVQDDPPRPLDFLSLTSMCDSFVPRIFVRRQGRFPAGTISLTTHFHADTHMLLSQGSKHVLGLARASRFGMGYHDQSAEIWSDSQQLLATSHQLVYYKA